MAGPFELLRARYVIESECAALAAKSAKKAQFQAIEAALDEMRHELDDGHQPLSGDRLFHLRIAEATGNGALVHVIKMLWEERTGELYKQLEDHYDSPALWTAAMAEHEAVLEGDRGQGRRGCARRDAAPPQPGVQTIQQGLGYAAVARPPERRTPCSPPASTPRKTCASTPSTCPAPAPARCC